MKASTYEKVIEALVDKLETEVTLRELYERKYYELLKKTQEDARNGNEDSQ